MMRQQFVGAAVSESAGCVINYRGSRFLVGSTLC